MKPRRLTRCPGCRHPRVSKPYRIARQPVVLNYRFTTPAAAARVRRRDIVLVQCQRCGLVFNTALDTAAIPYDANYENRQCFSPAFQNHLQSLADHLIGRHQLSGKKILEVGCGKGDFLRLLCRRARANGVGYDTSFSGPAGRASGGVTFYRGYVSAPQIRDRFDALICRHVVEHVPNIGEFLAELRAIAAACGNPVTVIETPAFEWITANLCFWDVFYEHCNYFTRPCLAWLCQRAGFRAADHRVVFGGQYQLLELKLGYPPKAKAGAPPAITATGNLGPFARQAQRRLITLEKELRGLGAARGWAIWGAGAKGVALVNRLQSLKPRFVIDSNPAKQGCFVPGSRVPVIGPTDPRIPGLALVLVANPNYEAEISSILRENGFVHTIRTL